MPAIGEKLVCLRNDRVKGLLNGSTWTVHALRAAPRPDTVRLDVVPEDDPALRRRPTDIKVLRQIIAGLIDDDPETQLTLEPHQGEALAWLYEHGRVTARDADELGRTHVTVRLHPAALGRFERLYPDLTD